MKKIRILVTGASGMLGTALIDFFSSCNFEIFAISREIGYQNSLINWKSLDLFDEKNSKKYLEAVKPDVVIHCAALVNVDACEKNVTAAEWLHAGSVKMIVDSIKEWGGRLIYISTDAVFDGCKKGLYLENDKPNPKNVYSNTKHHGELLSLSYENSLVIRTNIFGWSYKAQNAFAEWIIEGLIRKEKLKMFVDVEFTPVNVYFLSKVISKIIETKDLLGIYHVTGSEKLSKYEFSKLAALVFGLDDSAIIPCSIEDSSLVAFRPKNMALSNQWICESLDLKLPEAREGLELMKRQYRLGLSPEKYFLN